MVRRIKCYSQKLSDLDSKEVNYEKNINNRSYGAGWKPYGGLPIEQLSRRNCLWCS